MPDKSDIKFEQPSPTLLVVNQYLWVVLLIILLFTLVFGYFLILDSKITSIKESKDDTTEVVSKQAEIQDLVNKITILESRYQSIQNQRISDLRRLKQIIPVEPEIAELFVIADRLAVNRGFKLDSIDINQDTQILQNKDEDLVTQGLDALLVNMSVSREVSEDNPLELHPYDAFKQYLTDLESNLRLMDVQTVDFGTFDVTEDGGGLRFNFTVITYFSADSIEGVDINNEENT